MIDYLIGYRLEKTELRMVKRPLFFYTFKADDAEHALEQFRDAEPNIKIEVVFVVMV